MTITATKKPLSLIMAKETYRKLLTDPKAQIELLIQMLARYSPDDTNIDGDYIPVLYNFELALLSVERRFLKLKERRDEYGGQ